MADPERSRAKSGSGGGKGSTQRPLSAVAATMKTPDNVEIRQSARNTSHLGIWSQAAIPEGTKFGPYQGERTVTLKKDSDPLFVWEIVDLETKEFLFYLDGTKVDQANWLRHVQRARHYEEQNILADQDGIDIIYTTIKPIERGEELLTWYKTPTTRRGQRQAGRESRGRAKSMKELSSKSPVSKPPAPKSSAPRSPAPRSPVLKTSAPRSPAPKSPAPRSPAPRSPAPKSPAPMSPAPKSPAPRSPAPRSPAPRSPAPKSPAPRSPAHKSSAPKSSVSKAPPTFGTVSPKKKPMKMTRVPSPCPPSPVNKPAEVKDQVNVEEEEEDKQEQEMETDLDRDRDSSDLEIDLDEGDGEDDEDDEEEDEDSDITDGKVETSKNTQSEDPEKFHFKLKKTHITKSRHGRKVFKCDICSGIYRHAFSLKRHYIRNHINLKYVSRGDILNCQINPDSHDFGPLDDKDSVSEATAEGQGQNHDSGQEVVTEKDSVLTDSKMCDSDLRQNCDTKPNVNLIGGVKKDHTRKDGSKQMEINGKLGQACDLEHQEKMIKTEIDTISGQSSPVSYDDTKDELTDSSTRDLSGLYRCNVCSSFFNTVALLKSHLDNHPNLPSSKAFACSQCDMKFAHKQNLRRHLAVHTGEKPFICKFCGKMFPTATNQKRHERIHLGRRVACEYCSSTFTQSGDLKKHIRKLHPECFHECAFCGKYFTDEEELIDHVVSHNESMQSNEAERHRRRHAFKVDMELDRIESMRLAEQKTPGVKFACTVCKKRFLDYANMCRHRRLAHQRHLLLGHGSNSSSPVPSPTKLASDSSDGDPQAFFYANVANNISENLTNYIEGTKEHLEKTSNQMKLSSQLKEPTEHFGEVKPKVEADLKDTVSYNFPAGFCLKQNYRKVVTEKDKSIDKLKKIKVTSKMADLKETNKPLDLKVKDTPELYPSESNKCVRLSEVRTVKVVDPKLGKVNKEETDTKPVISMVNGVSLNIPVFNLSNIAKREVKTQPVCTVQPIQRQSNSITEHKPVDTQVPIQPKKEVNPSNDKPSVSTVNIPIVSKSAGASVNGPPPQQTPSLSPVKLVTKQQKAGGGGKSSGKPGVSAASCLALKIPQVHVCSVCRRLFNNEAVFRQHMLEKHKTTPEATALQREQKEKAADAMTLSDNGEPAIDLSGKPSTTVSQPSEKPADKEKAILDHDEGARLLLDFALGIRDEPRGTPSPAVVAEESPKSTEEHFPLDLSANVSAPGASVVSADKVKVTPRKAAKCAGRVFTKSAEPVVAHAGNLAPAAHSGNAAQGKVQGLLRIPTYHVTKDLDLPAPLVSPPGTPRSPWQPQLPSLLCGPLPTQGGSRKFVCSVCHGEFPSRNSLLNHQRATHADVRCDHVEVDADAVAPCWQKPSPVGMLNVCSSQISEFNQADQEQFKCTKCQKAFKAVEDLHGHIFECASIGKSLLKPAKTKLNLLSLHAPATTVRDDAEAAAAAVAAAGLRLLAASQPRLPIRDPHLSASISTSTIAPSLTTPTSTTSALPGTILSTNTTTTTTSMLERFKSSILKKLKKKKKKREQEDGLGLMTKKRRRSLELLYNPQNHVRRREMTEVVDMQRCQGCGQRFTTISLLERHIPVCTEKERLKEIQIIRNPFEVVGDHVGESRNVCHYCSKQFTYAGMLRKHVFEVCQVRRTRLQEARPLDITWEQELSQHYSGAQQHYSGVQQHYSGAGGGLDAGSNDGSHAEDAVSVATSTSSSHDADTGQRARRRKRKNRGWGNGKKKRASTNLDLARELAEMFAAGGGTAAVGEEEEEEEVEEEGDGASASDTDQRRGEQSKTDFLNADLVESSQSGDELKIVEDVVEEKEVQCIVNEEPVVKTESKPKVEPVVEVINSDIKEAPKQSPFIGRHTLPFVLSIPQYRERTPLTTKSKNSRMLLSSTTSPAAQIKSISSEKQKLDQTANQNKNTGVTPEKQKSGTPNKVGCTPLVESMDVKDSSVLKVGGSSVCKSAEVDGASMGVPEKEEQESNPARSRMSIKQPTFEGFPAKMSSPEKTVIPGKSSAVFIDLQGTGKLPSSGNPDDFHVKVITEHWKENVISGPNHPQISPKVAKCDAVKHGNLPVKEAGHAGSKLVCETSSPAVKSTDMKHNTMTPQILSPLGKSEEQISKESEPRINPVINKVKVNEHDGKCAESSPSTSSKDIDIKTSVVEKEYLVRELIKNDVNKEDLCNQEKPKSEISVGVKCAASEQKPSTCEDSDESSDEEDIKEIINTVLAQRRQSQKLKKVKPKKQKKIELKTMSASDKTVKSNSTNPLPEATKVSSESTESTAKPSKSKTNTDTTGKPTKSKPKKKVQSQAGESRGEKTNSSHQKEENKKSATDSGKSESKKGTTASPKKCKSKKKTENVTKDTTKDSPVTKKKKISEKDGTEKKVTNKDSTKSKTTKTKVKKGKISEDSSDNAKKSTNLESPAKAQNKSKPSSPAKKAQSEGEQQSKKDTGASPVKNRKRKGALQAESVPSSPVKDSASKSSGPSPSKLMKTRGGATVPNSPVTEPAKKSGLGTASATKTRRVSVRGTRSAASESEGQGSEVKVKGRIGTKSSSPKLKRSVSACTKTSTEEKVVKGRALNGSTSMRTRQSRLSL